MIWRDRSTPGPTTTLLAAPTTTLAPSTTVVITTNVEASTAVPTEDQRKAEVEDILTDLWFGWFDAIYRKDADALWDVVATTPFHQAGVEAMSAASFDAAPVAEDLDVVVERILLDREDCLVVLNTISIPFLEGAPTNTSVKVMWPDADRSWRFATSWLYPGDRWQADCDDVVREETP
jgi:hypothetical protein